MKRQHLSFDDYMREELKDPGEAREFLQVSFEEYKKDGDYGAFLHSLRHVVEAQGGMSAIARASKLNRRNLYDALSANGQPGLNTVGAVLDSLGFRLSIVRKREPRKAARKPRTKTANDPKKRKRVAKRAKAAA